MNEQNRVSIRLELEADVKGQIDKVAQESAPPGRKASLTHFLRLLITEALEARGVDIDATTGFEAWGYNGERRAEKQDE